MGAELELRRHIERFDLDAGAFCGYFTTKLAHDNGWALAFAERVVGEYRRYVYLACTADHVVVPSDEVDMAWHQHLLDTEQYWGEFCQTVLNRPLHHRPNKGGEVGQQDHLDLYRCTLRTYERTFGCEPPEDIWPPAARRFEPRSAGGRKTFVRNPLSGPAPISTICAGVLLALALPATVAWVDPPADAPNAFGLDDFDWAGGTSLVALAVAAMLAVLMSYGLRRTLLSADTSAAADAARTAMDPYETAVLNSNTQHAVNVAIAALVRDDVLGFDGTHRGSRTYSLIRTGPIPTQSHPLEHAAYDAVATDGSTTLSEVHDRVRVDAKRILESLRSRNLLRRHDRYFGRRCAVAGPIVLTALLGGLLIPTADAATAGIIVMSTVVILIFAIGLSAAPPHLTAFGLDVLNATRDEHQPKSYVGRDNVVDGRALSWVLALQGATVLRASLSTLRDAITAPAEKGGGGRGVKSAGCGGGTKRSGGSAGAGGYAGSGCGGGYAGSGCGGGSGCGSGCGGGCGGGSS